MENQKTKKSNKFSIWVKNYFSHRPGRIKSPKELENDKYLIKIGNYFSIKFNRYVLFVSSVLVQFCVGSFYAWSIYNKPIDNAIYGKETKGMAPITFYITVGVFGFTTFLSGPYIERHGPRRGILIGSILFAVAHWLTALGIYVQTIWLVFFGYGLFAGMGIALCYISPVSSLQKWFPDKRGLSSGLSVMGFGAGSIAFGKIPLHIINSVGLANNFLILGGAFLFMLLIQAYLFRNPPPGYTVHGMNSDGEINSTVQSERESTSDNSLETNSESSISDSSDGGKNPDKVEILEAPKVQYTLRESLKSREFKLLYFIFLGNVIFGLVMISRLSNMVQDIFFKDKSTASMVVSVNGGFNLFGRIFFAYLSDKIGRKQCYFITISSLIIIISILPIVISNRSYPAFIALIWIACANYGGAFGIIPAFLNDLFGSKNVSSTHGVILTAWSISGVVGGILFTEVYDHLVKSKGVHDPEVYNVNIYWIIPVVLISWVLLWFVRVSPLDRQYPPIEGQIFRISIFSRMLRLSKSKGLEFLSKSKQIEEWNTFISNSKAKELEELGKKEKTVDIPIEMNK
ncbi:hypothetical protein DLAC_08115 [Tieghemostelium lacteum]|uniref:Major facilitator superfamily (MFS) profile domain-containing protein n=1 Tax=Tieghemostelium lacteum TaxID=361077 RepID=A0A151ZB84_TIELA|nr:hypothetical protein DLAC_08115 [Tieghemostelium lacteum]|eukprot:KYQ91196.1 hypothetical protein DLAC_08115 [Tieghemostelium lacteum]